VPPKWLKGEARRIFDRRAPALRAAKLLTEADVDAFARYCKHYERWIGYQKRLDKEGDIYEIVTASGTVRRADPAFIMADRLDRMMLAFEDRFGLNPAERQRIMIARANTGVSGDLFAMPSVPAVPPSKRPDDPAADAAKPAEPTESPVGFLN
jgi:P27 family predicted phage terminase small subunit